MKKLLAMAVAVAGVVGYAIGAEDEVAPEGTQKILLRIATVETPDTRTAKTWNPPAEPIALQELPYSEADFANATAEEAKKMAEANRQRRLANQKAQTAVAIRAYEQAQAHFEGTKKKLEGTVFGKQIILAIDKFAGAAGEHFDSDCIEFFHRMDSEDEGAVEKFMQGKEKEDDTLKAAYLVKLIFDNPRFETGKVKMHGQEIKRTTITIAVTYQVQAINGRMATSGNVKTVKQLKSTGAVQLSGVEDGLLVDAIDEALNEVAKRINNHFVAKVTFKAVSAGGKKDADFDAEAATIEIDGVSADLDSEISIMKGPHKIVVDLDEYKQKGSVSFNIKKSGPIKIVLKKAAPKKEAKEKDEE